MGLGKNCREENWGEEFIEDVAREVKEGLEETLCKRYGISCENDINLLKYKYIVKITDIHDDNVKVVYCECIPTMRVMNHVYKTLLSENYDLQDLNNCKVRIIRIEDGGDI